LAAVLDGRRGWVCVGHQLPPDGLAFRQRSRKMVRNTRGALLARGWPLV